MGISAALSLSIILSAASLVFLVVWWDENKPNQMQRSMIFTSFGQGIQLLKKPAILSLAITDSIYQCSIQIFIFIWTPVLQYTAQTKFINPGMIFMMCLISFLIQNKFLELINKLWKVNYFILSCCYLLFFTCEYFVIYIADDYATRLIILAFINVKLT
jgi:hypothetical protein